MTAKEDALLRRIEDLEQRVRFLSQSPERQHFFTSAADSATEFGGGSLRLDEDGLKFANFGQSTGGAGGAGGSGVNDPASVDVIAAGQGQTPLFPGLYFFPRFDHDIYTEGYYSQIVSWFDDITTTAAHMLIVCATDDLDTGNTVPSNGQASITLDSVIGTGHIVTLDANGVASISAADNASGSYVEATGEGFVFPNAGSGPPSILSINGSVFYDASAHKLYLRANGAWVALASEGFTIPITTIDAKGDLLVGSADDAVDNLTVGANYKALFADSAQTLGLGYRPTWYLLDATGAANTFNTTASETTLYTVTVPANSMGANGVVHMVIHGYYKNNSAGTDTFRLRIKFGGTTWYSDLTAAFANNADLHPFTYDIRVGNLNATNAQWVTGTLFMNFGTATTGIGDIKTIGAGQIGGVVASDPTSAPNIDTSSAQALLVSITHTTSDANIETSRRYAYCEVMTTP